MWLCLHRDRVRLELILPCFVPFSVIRKGEPGCAIAPHMGQELLLLLSYCCSSHSCDKHPKVFPALGSRSHLVHKTVKRGSLLGMQKWQNHCWCQQAPRGRSVRCISYSLKPTLWSQWKGYEWKRRSNEPTGIFLKNVLCWQCKPFCTAGGGEMQLVRNAELRGSVNVCAFLFFTILSYNPYASLWVMLVEFCCSAAVWAMWRQACSSSLTIKGTRLIRLWLPQGTAPHIFLSSSASFRHSWQLGSEAMQWSLYW